MIKTSKTQTMRILSVHGWSGVLLGLALYIVVFTGAIAVFAHDIALWGVSGTPVQKPLSQNLDAHVRNLAQQVPDAYLEELTLFYNPAGQIIAFFHTHKENDNGQMGDYGTRFVFDPISGVVLQQHEGFRDDLPEDPYSALDRFLVQLHINLHAPDPWGLYLTGILGLVLLAAAATGFILHRHLLKDMFLPPRRSSLGLNARDKHNLAATWGLPFSIILAVTGAFYSFAISLGLPVIAMSAFGGDQEKVIETLVGIPEAENPQTATLTNLDHVIANATERYGVAPDFASIHHLSRADSKIILFHFPAGGTLTPTQYQYSGATGEFLGIKPQIGTVESVGNTTVGVIAALHFGHFAGWISRVIWLALGLSVCYVTITGIQLWVQRRALNPLWQRLGRTVIVVGYGLPIAIAASALGFFIGLPLEKSTAAVTNSFVYTCVLLCLLGVVIQNADRLLGLFRGLLGSTLLILPLTRMALSDVYWADLYGTANNTVMVLDIVLMLAGGWYVYQATRIFFEQNKSSWASTEMSGEVTE
ncbi:iron-regulated membrane-like protein [Oleiphilus messinensis]|uniref:Iron-regulated membrane-like protein n=1 Tax=Oleiphilus messinensis TaxID=141451 RepID=A0A1Y0IG61_9GAMM|nr:PepSY-associated TM helix domain-containing protein [Oleiphilus messinensis]ARU59488.1 iron-regulated membrane-like protein [Oleiphilus messinensis]